MSDTQAIKPGEGVYDPSEGQWGQGPNPLDPADGHDWKAHPSSPQISSGCTLCGRGFEKHCSEETRRAVLRSNHEMPGRWTA